MFYTLQEVAQALGKTDEQVQKLIDNGKLREFRDGAKLLFKVEEVEKLKADVAPAPLDGGDSVIELTSDQSGQVPLESGESAGEIDLASITGSQIPFGSELNLGDITSGDTTIGTTGVNVLGETDDGYKIAADSRLETRMAGDSKELSELDDDINLDSVGSGSGLLDLSLQADDTSLGAVLDDILPSAEDQAEILSHEQQQADVIEEADKIFEQSEHDEGMTSNAQPIAMQYFEPEPTGFGKACGVAMLIPLITVIFAATAVVCGFKSITPSTVSILKGNVLVIVMSSLIVIVLAVTGIGAMLGGKKKDK